MKTQIDDYCCDRCHHDYSTLTPGKDGLCSKCAAVSDRTGIDVLDNPHSDKNIQVQLIKSAIWQQEKQLREWATCARRDSRGVQTMIREYTTRLQTLKTRTQIK